MIYFQCDYAEGCHPKVLEKLIETNLEQSEGYGLDAHCDHARALIRKACGTPDADVHFLVGGTQTNTTVIASVLRPHQGVIAADTGHIACHETGAIEATGHKVLTVPNENGLLSGAQIRAYCQSHYDDAARSEERRVGKEC